MKNSHDVRHVIIDTDIGGDPDDLFALLLAINCPEMKIDLVVTCDEHKGHRASFARKLLKELGKGIPVVKGSDLGNSKCCVVCDLVQDYEKQDDYLSAVKNIIDKNQKTNYLCIGPQTNLAKF